VIGPIKLYSVSFSLLDIHLIQCYHAALVNRWFRGLEAKFQPHIFIFMNQSEYTQNNLTASVILLLAVIFITACDSQDASLSTSTRVAAATTTSHTPTLTPTSSPSSLAQTLTKSTSLPITSTPAAAEKAGNDQVATRSKGEEITPTSLTPTQQAAEPAAATSPLSPTKMPVSASVDVYETTITLPTYPFREYLVEQIDPVYNIPVYYFNRAEYEAAGPTPTPVDYKGVVLENSYLRLTFIPELGGRLYSAVVKATNQEIFYQNKVVKPSRYGVLQPYEANWWLATGGMEWAYPTQEHGYRFGVPWDYQVSQNSTGATITLSDTAPDRVGLEVSVTLPADSSAFTVSPTLINQGPGSVSIQLWINAALSLSSGSMSPNTRFTIPADVVTVHSRGESGWTVPGQRSEAPWPQVGDTDLRDYSQWANYLGFFVPNQDAPFIGAYNPGTDLGVVRLAASQAASSSGKLFAFGTGFPDRSYTDDDSQYFEIWGGANAGFWPEDDIVVPVGQTLGWVESWWPLAGLGGVTWATEQVAINLAQSDGQYTLSALVSRPTQGDLRISANTVPIISDPFSTDPTTPLVWHFADTDEPILIQFMDKSGSILLEYRTE